MASKLPAAEEGSNSKTTVEEEENLALRVKKKRARRVSFADTEITSVHIFNRDEDSETPPLSARPTIRNPNAASLDPENEVIGFFRDLASESDDSGDDDGTLDARKPFLRPIGSPSPGSSTADDNFFGPVSASFIRPGRLSSSAASDEHHEETLDTTAFSMHYRSLARSESGELKTPTAVRLEFEEKATATATKDSNRTNSGNSMTLTEVKKLSSQSLVPFEKVRFGEDSNDMSIVDANPNKYDYGRLSPTLDALLAESSKDLNAESVSVPVPIISRSPLQSEVSRPDRNGTSHADSRNGSNSELGNFDLHEKLGESKGGSVDRVAFDYLSKQSNGPAASLSNHQIQSPNQLIGVKQQQSVFNTPISARHSTIVSPSLKQSNFQSNDYMNQDRSILSIQKSNSRLRIPHHSYSGSSIKQGTDNLKRRLSKYSSLSSSRLSLYSSLSSPYGSILDVDGKELLSEHVGAPIGYLEEQLFTAGLKNEDRSLASININEVETPRITTELGQTKEIICLVNDGEPLHSMSTSILSKDKPSKPTTPLSSRLQLASSGKVTQQALNSEDSANKMLSASGTDSTVAYDHGTDLPHMKIDSRTLQNVQSPRDKVILNFQLESSEKNCQIGTKLPLSTFYASGTTPGPTTLQSPSIKKLTHSPFKEVLIQSSPRETPNQKGVQKESTESASRKSPTESSPMKSICMSPLKRDPTLRSPRKVPPPAQSSPRKESTLLFPSRESSLSPSMKKLIWSPHGIKAIQGPARKEPKENPSRMDTFNATNGGDMLSFIGKDMASPKSDNSRCVNDNLHEELHISQSPFSEKDAEISFERKRRSSEVVLEDGQHAYKNPRIQKSPEVHQIGNYDSELFSYHVNNILTETENTVGDRIQKHWLDILVKFSRDADQFLSLSINKLNLKVISMLEDVLLHFSKVKKYEILGSEIPSQKVADLSSVRHYKRWYDCFMIISWMSHFGSCLQKRVLPIDTGIEECQMLKSNYIQQSQIGRVDTQLEDSHLQSCSDVERECQVASDTVIRMKQEIKTLDGKINSLSNFFHTYFKLKGEPSCGNSLASVQDHLKRRKCCRLICQDLQLWKVDRFESQNGYYNVVLNYQGYLSQRFTLNSGPVSSIVISNQLNDINILKIFPNMDAHLAFAFVLNAEAIKRGVGLKFIAQETQVTHSLLCNLLDVVEEVQMAQIEIANLIRTNFSTPSGQQLSLQLCFINFHTGIKVTLSLDVTCLNSGVYPSQILPYQVQNSQAGRQKSKSLEGEIRSAAESLEYGYMRIMRLCRCVSQVLQASSI
ncbi:hypothetical protein PanWU01x14_268370 [Parasponia andersonii]|uniref:Knl1 C-terminal RWD domain-containing protein n=1 Tax=Parasponia andersonii TaxID=3476 RepID=A0A2P5B635_PARAD|nr:hypothetical protein PanWU01x14_268370 [Parasponia andersonii]